MVRRIASKATLATALLLGSVAAMPLAAAVWIPPPAEWADTSVGAGLEVDVQRWDPSLGAAASLLDVLPPGSPAAGDFNGDGLTDFFVPSPQYTDDGLNAARSPASALMMNDRGQRPLDDRFVEVTDVSGVEVDGHAYAASWTDYDNDGWPDLFVGGYRMAQLFHNNGDSTFTDVTAQAGLPQDGLVLGGAWGDYDDDGLLDVLLVQFSSYTHPDDGPVAGDFSDVPGKANVLMRNQGDGTFSDASAAAGLDAVARRSTSAVWVDLDRDGDRDLYVTNHGQPAEFWRNLGGGAFQEEAASLGLANARQATCQAWEDFDNDGDLDLLTAHNDGAPGLHIQGTLGTFSDQAASLGITAVGGRSWGCAAIDFDGDSDMDIVVANGALDGTPEPDTLYMSHIHPDGTFMFSDQSAEAGDRDIIGWESHPTFNSPVRGTSGLMAVDLDFDAYTVPELVTTSDGFARFFKNIEYLGGWGGGAGEMFNVILEGTTSNRLGLGAEVTVQAGTIEVTRVMGSQMGWGGASHVPLHFGILKKEDGNYDRQSHPVNVTIRWPSGLVERYDTHLTFQGNVAEGGFEANRMVRFTEGGGALDDVLAPRPVMALKSGTAGSNNWYTSDSVTLNLRAFDRSAGGSLSDGNVNPTLRYSLDGSTWTTVASPRSAGATLTFDGDGTHKLWVETEDSKGNRAVYLYPIRIDSAAPAGTLTSPAPGSVYAQGREVAGAGDPADLNRAVVLVPVPVSGQALGEAGPMLDALAGSDGGQPVAADAADATSGVRSVHFMVTRSTGQPVGMEATRMWHEAPFTWNWMAGTLPAGEYKIHTTVTDFAGNAATFVNKVLLVPTTAEGVQATLPGVGQGPSLPTLN